MDCVLLVLTFAFPLTSTLTCRVHALCHDLSPDLSLVSVHFYRSHLCFFHVLFLEYFCHLSCLPVFYFWTFWFFFSFSYPFVQLIHPAFLPSVSAAKHDISPPE
ncbi:unnamed protein product [Brugia timori]|uniref:Secreted protein n=1 Tax=Brugia timori TaxID=42155 RepID=A0A3P7VLN3_9BILA|nr:unnamed protein product [Brugia timori]